MFFVLSLFQGLGYSDVHFVSFVDYFLFQIRFLHCALQLSWQRLPSFFKFCAAVIFDD